MSDTPDLPTSAPAPQPPPAANQPAMERSEDARTATAVAEPPLMRLPPFKVLLHNDDVNDMLHVVESLVQLTPLTRQDAARVTVEAHEQGIALVTVTHKERAELYAMQLRSKSLTATIEPA